MGNRKDERDRYILSLENELAQTRLDIRNITEDQESANEELLSSSEELQSVNEELETSKEELQASNEELLGLNQELIDRQEQLFVARNYSEAIVTSINTPIVILDKDLRIKSANKTFYSLFNTSEVLAHGKLVFELNATNWDTPEFRTLLEKVIPNRFDFKDFEHKVFIPSVGEKILLLSGKQLVHEKAMEEFVLLVIQEVTDSRMSENLRESEDRFRLATELTGLGTWELNFATNRINNSAKIQEIMGIDQTECSVEEFLRHVHADDLETARSSFKNALENGHLFFEARIIGKDEKQRWIRVNGKTISNTSNQPTRLLGTVMDISRTEGPPYQTGKG